MKKMKKLFTVVLFAVVTCINVYSQKDTTQWNVPKGKWFIEIGTPGIGVSFAFSSTPILKSIEPVNFNWKLPSFSIYFKDSTGSFYNGFSMEYSFSYGSLRKNKINESINDGFLLKSDPSWDFTSLKFKYRGYQKLNKKVSMSFGVGCSYNVGNIDANTLYNVDGREKTIASMKNSNEWGFCGDFGVNWEIAKWFSMGLRTDFDYFSIKLNSTFDYGSYETTSTAFLISLSPAMRVKF